MSTRASSPVSFSRYFLWTPIVLAFVVSLYYIDYFSDNFATYGLRQALTGPSRLSGFSRIPPLVRQVVAYPANSMARVRSTTSFASLSSQPLVHVEPSMFHITANTRSSFRIMMSWLISVCMHKQDPRPLRLSPLIVGDTFKPTSRMPNPSLRVMSSLMLPAISL